MATKSGDASKRQALLDGALACFLEHGVVETTMELVLARSGASVGSLYHHFGGKEQLADALYVECLGAYHRRRLRPPRRRPPRPRPACGRIVEHHLDWIVEHTDRAKFLLAYRDHEIRASERRAALAEPSLLRRPRAVDHRTGGAAHAPTARR